MFPTLTLGPLVIPTAPLTVLIGLWVALAAVERAARVLELDVNQTYGLATTGIIAGFVGARLAFVGLHWPAYQDNLLGILWPINSGYHLLGGLVAGGLALVYVGRWRRLPAARTLDALTPGVVTGLIFVSLADFLGGPGYGDPTTLPWGISLFGIRRHPVQVYEIAVGLVALAVWAGSLPPRGRDGRLLLSTTATYALGRLLVDAYRANAPLTAEGYHTVQIASLAVALIALILIARQAAAATSGDDQR